MKSANFEGLAKYSCKNSEFVTSSKFTYLENLYVYGNLIIPALS